MKKILILFVIMLLALLLFTGCGCSHEWLPATCDAAQSCSLCGETQGEALHHQWSPATCEESEKCALCGDVRGEALQHKWEDASCLQPEKCSVCGKERGEALGHSEGKAEYSNLDIKAATGDCVIYCKVCGELMESSSGSLKSLHNGKEFICTTLELYERLLHMHKYEEYDLGGFGDTDEYGGLFALIYWDSDFISRMVFKKADGSAATPEDTFSTVYLNLGWNKGLLDTLSENRHEIHSVPLMVACDPTLSHDEALELYASLMGDDELTLSHNGLAYMLYYDEEAGALTMSVTVE
ncbi:MAG: hypothetical protein E7420_01270 [Ruminococcaceae bacterium]|nr:hypothetical protein [Oscillospiraceae bacterium]